MYRTVNKMFEKRHFIMRRKTKRQHNQERIENYLRRLKREQKPLPTIAAIARDLDIGYQTVRGYLLDMERSGIVAIGRDQRNRIIVSSIRLVEWEPVS